MLKNESLIFAFILGACGGSTGPEPVAENDPATTGGEADPAAGSRSEGVTPWVIAPLTMTDSGGQAMRIDAEGILSVDGNDGPTVQFHSNGDITVDGERVGQMALDGVLRLADGTVVATIGPDGVTEVDGRAVSWGPDGTLVGGNPSGPGITLAPADSPAKRLAMTALLMMTMTGAPTDDAPAASPAGAEPVQQP